MGTLSVRSRAFGWNVFGIALAAGLIAITQSGCPISEPCTLPVASAGVDRQVSVGTRLELNGLSSTDASGAVLTYHWDLSMGNGLLENADSAIASFRATEVGVVMVALTVSNGCNADEDTVRIVVADEPTASEPITCDGSCSDGFFCNGAEDCVDGQCVSGSNPCGNEPCCEITDSCGECSCRSDQDCPAGYCDVTTGQCESSVSCTDILCNDDEACDPDTLECIPNTAPIANAGSSQTAFVGDLVTLDGSQSVDFDGDAFTYSWSQLSGPSVALNGANAAAASFVVPEASAGTIFEFSLIVQDQFSSSGASIVSITVMASSPCAFPLSFTSETFFSGGAYASGVIVEDMDADGTADVIVANSSNYYLEDAEYTNVALLRGAGEALLDPARSFYSGFRSNHVAVGDVNGDGYLDVVTSNFGDGTIGILIGTTSGIFDGTKSGTISVGGEPRGVVLADFNDDGSLDIIVANAPFDELSILLNFDSGRFSAPRTIDPGTSTDGPSTIAVGDFNKDGCADIAVTLSGYYDHVVAVNLGFCDGTFTSSITWEVENNPLGIVTGDFDADGNIDLVVANSVSDTVTVLFGDGLGAFPTKQSFGTGYTPAGVAVGDIDEDGLEDFVVTVYGENLVRIFWSNGNGSFRTGSYAAGPKPNHVAVGDLDGDGDLDLVVSNAIQEGNLTVLRNRCEGF